MDQEFGKGLSRWFITNPHGTAWGRGSWRILIHDGFLTPISGASVFLAFLSLHKCLPARVSSCGLSFSQHGSPRVVSLLIW